MSCTAAAAFGANAPNAMHRRHCPAFLPLAMSRVGERPPLGRSSCEIRGCSIDPVQALRSEYRGTTALRSHLPERPAGLRDVATWFATTDCLPFRAVAVRALPGPTDAVTGIGVHQIDVAGTTIQDGQEAGAAGPRATDPEDRRWNSNPVRQTSASTGEARKDVRRAIGERSC